MAAATAETAGVPSPPEKAPARIKTPFRAPPSTSVPPRSEITPEESTKLAWLTERAREFTEVNVTSATAKVPSGPITDDERMWLTRECLLRFLRATRLDEAEAARRVMQSLAWRREFGVDLLTSEHVSPENETGKQALIGFDRDGRPCHYMNPARQNTDPSHRQVEHVVYMVERIVELMPPGQETLALLINFKQGKGRGAAPGIGLAREVLNILQMHYPERLGRALIINVPWLVWGFFKLITPLIDPRTVDKLKFNEDMTQYVAPEQLWAEYQDKGTLDFEYEHGEYWPALDRLGAEVRAERKARWVEGGKLVGELEDYIAGGLEVGAAGKAKGEAKEEVNGEEKVEEVKKETNGEAAGEGTETNGEKTDEAKPEELKVAGLDINEKKGEEKTGETKEEAKASA